MKRLFNRWLIFFIIVLGFSFFLFFSEKHFFILKNIDLLVDYEELNTPDSQKTKKELGIYFEKLKGQSIFQLPLANIQRDLLKDSRVESFQLRKIYPDQLIVKIQLKKMVLLYLNKKGEFFPVSEEGGLLPQIKNIKFHKKVVLRGGELSKSKEKVRQALSLIRHMKKYDELKESEISEIVFDKKEGFQIFMNELPVEIKLGFTELKKRADKVQKVLQYLKKQEVKSCVIDARLGKKVVVKLRNET